MSFRNVRISTAMLTSLFATVLAFAGPPGTTSSATTRSLVRDLAAAATAAGADRIALQLKTLNLGPRPDAPITQSSAVAILKGMGVQASTSNPDRALTPEQAATLSRWFQTTLESKLSLQKTFATGHGLPEDVDECFQEQNHGQCMDCCKGMGGTASTCAKACMVINKPSPEEPLP